MSVFKKLVSLCMILLLYGSILTSSTVYFNCTNVAGQHLQICKFLQSIDLTQNPVNINLDEYSDYCNIASPDNHLVINCVNDNITELLLRDNNLQLDWQDTGYQFNYTDQLGLPESLIFLDFSRLYIDEEFDFDYIYGLDNLEIFFMDGASNKKKMYGTIEWDKVSQMNSLREIKIRFRKFYGDLGFITNFTAPIERIDVCRYILYYSLCIKVINNINVHLFQILI